MNGKNAKVFLLCLAFLPGLLPGGGIESARHLEAAEGLLRPEKVPEQLLLLDFSRGAKWDEVVNFEDRLETGYGEKAGRRGFYLAGPEKHTDTAWQLRSAKFPLRGAGELAGRIDLSVQGPLRGKLAPHWEKYTSAVHWFSADGSPLGRTAFAAAVAKDGADSISFRMTVPPRAAAGRLSLGADSPNLGRGDVLLVTQVRVDGIPPGESRCFTDAEAVLPPVRFAPTDPVCTLSAETPEGTSVAAETAFAADKNGVPGKFSPFGPAARPVPEGTGWVKCRVKFVTDGKRRPALRAATVCGRTLSKWNSLSAGSAVIRRVSVSPSPDPAQPFVFSVGHGFPVDRKSLRVVLDGKDVTAELRRRDVVPEPPEMEAAVFTYKPDKPFAMRQVHKAVVSFSDICGKTFSKPLYFFFDEPLKTGAVTLRDDGVILTDGKPFFPVGACFVTPCPENGNSLDNAYLWLKKAGVNVIAFNPTLHRKDPRGALDKIAKYGLRVYFPPGDRKGANCQDLDAILRTVAEHYRHPALLAWYIGDDTILHNTPEQVAQKAEAIRAVDPWHPTCQADAVLPFHPPVFSPAASADDPSRFRPFVNCTDIFRAELYPVRNDSEKNAKDCVPGLIVCMRTVKRDLRDRAEAPKSIWGIVQYFEGWGKTKEKSTWKRYPTWQELRAMTWAVIIHGAKGLNWYTCHYYPNLFAHGFMYTEETRRNILRMTAEIVPLVPVLTERDNAPRPEAAVLSGPAKDVLGNDSLSVMARKHGGHLYLFALNSSAETIRARIALPGVSGGTVLYENGRRIAVQNGFLTDDFPPKGVHVYKLK
ncbi:MAG: hypothetical protein IJS01_12440 [Lentisphaeria bacterium]|nr:hypothetical protein [Lentisphaeria bacterium]